MGLLFVVVALAASYFPACRATALIQWRHYEIDSSSATADRSKLQPIDTHGVRPKSGSYSFETGTGRSMLIS